MKTAIAVWTGICVGMIVYGKKREREIDELIQRMNTDRENMIRQAEKFGYRRGA